MSDDSGIAITINDIEHTVLCGLCNTPIDFIGEPNAERTDAGCLACKNTANVQEVAKVALKFAEYKLAQLASSEMAEIARRSKVMGFKRETLNKPDNRFIVEL